ncbi:MAG TPA: arylsulfatase [Thermoguttaceae bacterium]|nr:arylsulfatase [Thermoguttaceae bacterium]
MKKHRKEATRPTRRLGAASPTAIPTVILTSLILTSLILTSLLIATGTGPLWAAEKLRAAEKPNVLLIMTDDQGYGDIQSHDNPKIDTPVMDGLAADGARFDRFFVSPVCAPTRASLLTGRYHLRTGVHGVTRAYETMRSSEVTIAEALKQAGYATGCFGKWHNGRHYPNHPNGQGFDEFVGFCCGHWNNYFDTGLEHNGEPITTEGYITDVLTDVALDFIERNKDRPFFCYVPYNAPHAPWQVPDRYFDKYKARGLDDKTACAYAMCESLDDNIGRLLKRLDQLDLADDTIVFFLTDNGPNSDRYNGGMKGRKGSIHEGGIRVPLFVRWPGRIEPGTVVRPITAHIDLLPTIVELCGVPMPKTLPLDGKSLVPLLRGSATDWPARMIHTQRLANGKKPNIGSIRTDRWRAVNYGKRWELYDMVADPGQKNDIAKQHPEVVDRLATASDAMFKDVTKDGFETIPIPVGYAQRPVVEMPGHEAFLESPSQAGISYEGPSGWANDYVTNWTDTEAYPWWAVDVVESGRYEVTLKYVCAEENLGATLRVTVAGQSVEGKITKAHDPEPIPSPDRVPRTEVYEKVWAPLVLGTVDLPKGKTRLVVRALDKPGREVVDLKAVQLRRVD